MDLDQLDSTTPLGLEYALQQSAGNNHCQVVELPIIEYAGSRVDQSSLVELSIIEWLSTGRMSA